MVSRHDHKAVKTVLVVIVDVHSGEHISPFFAGGGILDGRWVGIFLVAMDGCLEILGSVVLIGLEPIARLPRVLSHV
jgi:hypothetical protein